MKLYVYADDGGADSALVFVIGLLEQHALVDKIDDADAVVILRSNSSASGRALGEVYSLNQLFLLVHFTGADAHGELDLDMPPNVRCAGSFYVPYRDSNSWFTKMGQLTKEEVSCACDQARRMGFVSHRITERCMRRDAEDGQPTVLIVDDSATEMDRAVASIPAVYGVVAVNSHQAAMRELDASVFDYVLADLYMPALKGHWLKAYSYQLERVGRLVPLGLLIANEARAKGAKVAIVTDANHHQDPISATFDSGGYPGLVYDNHKDWAGSLAKLRK